MSSLDKNGIILKATKWAFITEVAAKLVVPITSIILARILTPEAFGVIATITMIISFADMFTDAGFQKYIVQHDFKNEEEKYKSINVAFWTNLAVSLLLWGIIAMFSEPIAKLVGNPGLGVAITLSCMQLPITSFSSIQIALYKRDFDFKTLFLVRIVSSCIPFIITIPLALIGISYWALIIGTIVGQISTALILTLKSKWKPMIFYDFIMLKEMLSFSLWSLIEAISIWLTAWVDTLIIGSVLSLYYVGIYKTSISMVNSLMGIITVPTTSILFSTLSRLQKDKTQFNNLFFKTQRLVSILVFPLGIGIFLYSDVATQMLLGNQWNDASKVIGVWSLAQAIVIVLGYYCSEVYRAKGLPKLSFLVQVLYMCALIPACIISLQYGFWTFVYVRALIVLEFIMVHILVMKFVIRFSILSIFKNVFPTAVSAIAMGLLGYFLKQINESIIWSFVSIIICIFFYCVLLYLLPNTRNEILNILKKIFPTNLKIEDNNKL